MEEIIIGPRTGDEEFFKALDYEKYPMLLKAKEASEAGDRVKAIGIFAEVARGILDTDKFFTLENKVRTPEFNARLKEVAERALRHELRSCGTTMKFGEKVDWFANPTYNQYKEWTWQLSRHSELVELANAYRACGDQRYATQRADFEDHVLRVIREAVELVGILGDLLSRSPEDWQGGLPEADSGILDTVDGQLHL